LETVLSSITCTEIRTGAWYGDELFTLDLPDNWTLKVHSPQTPPPLTDDQIAESFERPTGEAPIRELCRGKSRPLVIVDDLNRPTPACRVIPILLRHFEDAGIPTRAVRIIIATGTHGASTEASIKRKVGSTAASECEIIIHNSEDEPARVGKTSFGTPIYVDKAVTSSDFVIGIGGVYPNETAGFGGGSKLALGVLGFRSIRHLHYRHSGMGWGQPNTSHTLRHDLDEIARMIGMRTVVAMHIDARRDVIRLTSGDPSIFYSAEVEFARKTYSVPPPGDADVVISNAYPNDISVTSVHMKGLIPLVRCAPKASRIVVASCPEGLGHHGLFPLFNRPKHSRLLYIARRLATANPRDMVRKIVARAHPSKQPVKRNPIWLYRPGRHSSDLPFRSAEFQVTNSWSEILAAIREEHPGKRDLRAVLYPCAPLQVLEPDPT